MSRLEEFLGFIRPGICISTAALAAIGYLLHGRPDGALAYAILAAFFVCAAAYAYNNMTDIHEDLINRKRINYFSEKPAGRGIVLLCMLTGFYFALQLSAASILAYVFFMALGVGYSYLRIKKYLLLKNIWTAVGITQGMLIGAFAAGAGFVAAYIPVFLLAFTGSIIADMRDVEGDRKTDVRTLPTKIGIVRSARLVYVLIVATVGSILMAETSAFYIILPFTPVTAALVAKGMFVNAHATGKLSFTAVLIWLLISGNL